MTEKEALVTVYVAGGQPEAYIIKARLEAEGIPVLLSYESAGLVFGLTVDGLGEVKVMVPSSLAEEAKEILRTAETKFSDQAHGKESGNQSTLPEFD